MVEGGIWLPDPFCAEGLSEICCCASACSCPWKTRSRWASPQFLMFLILKIFLSLKISFEANCCYLCGRYVCQDLPPGYPGKSCPKNCWTMTVQNKCIFLLRNCLLRNCFSCSETDTEVQGCVCIYRCSANLAYPGKQEYFYIIDLISPMELAVVQ